MEWLQLPAAFACGAAGCLSMAKLLRLIGTQPHGSVAPRNTLFVNGEQDRVLARIDELITANRERRRQTEQVAEEVRVERRERIRDVEDIRGIIEQFARRIDAGGL